MTSSSQTPISAVITLVDSYGVTAVGQTRTGTIMVSPAEHISPVISISATDDSPRYGVRLGNVAKTGVVDFEPIESSSESS